MVRLKLASVLWIIKMDVAFYASEFRAKCESKEINPANFFIKLEQRLPQYKGRWEASMKDQIQELPDFDQVVREVMRHVKKLGVWVVLNSSPATA